MCFTGPYHKIIRLFLLQDPPHAIHILGCKSPVPFCIEVSQIQEFVLPGQDSRNCPGNLASDKSFTPSW